ncbi:MAG TPA: insulinase family protein [Candidatus Onthousia excrementipullorum]|uniref:Insulinase family protein n=1 Tax=Candidatus Onthousia excrementipullorum TaxID=2840884 RepID=A0A9D1DTB9_9FIRM|nr:insulinase family protein [Candidatus Onthousia excrementipullorum]
MDYVKKDLGAYNLHIIKTNLYKTITVKIFFREEALKENITKRNFLSRMMMLGSNDYKTKVELTKAEQDLYAVNISSTNRRIGNYLDTGISLKVLHDKYTEEGNFEKSLDLLDSLIFNPKVTNNAFDEVDFNTVYEEYKADLSSLVENKMTYALIKGLEATDNKSVISYRGIGYLEDLEKITKENLYDYYKNVISHNFVDIFVLGDVDEEKITNIIREKFKINTFKKKPIKALVEPLKVSRIKTVKEKVEAEQDNLIITLSLNNLTDYERNYPLSLYNAILGGGSESLLFSEVREKNSLAYYVSSTPNKLDNLIIIRGGITKDKSMDAVNIIKKILKDLEAGKIDDDRVEKAKEYYTSAIDDIIESPFQIIESYYMIELLGVDDIETKRKKMLKVTKDEIIALAKKVKINTIYILEGSDDNGEN